MRIALISDIHGNEVALEAVLKDIKKAGVDQIACLGDVVALGPLPVAVLQMIQDLDCPCVLGNHDAFMIDPPPWFILIQMFPSLLTRLSGAGRNCQPKIWILSGHFRSAWKSMTAKTINWCFSMDLHGIIWKTF
jgi:predicted phosphodiesterase